MQSLKEQYPDGFVPDEEWYRAFIAKAIVFRITQALVKARKFSAYQANITAYTSALLSWKSGGRIDFEFIWSQQVTSNNGVLGGAARYTPRAAGSASARNAAAVQASVGRTAMGKNQRGPVSRRTA
jgi:hypothetical protein